ncbi:lysostaphin resistance A-like protein [Poriferisphaera sp. WC338]|uniref:CPBP family intramembrane glutamic endopeptidase n=1 Tax=Poriferisphaera sp. WC338 TaxID=3425129 RepID=UPI003D81583C
MRVITHLLQISSADPTPESVPIPLNPADTSSTQAVAPAPENILDTLQAELIVALVGVIVAGLLVMWWQLRKNDFSLQSAPKRPHDFGLIDFLAVFFLYFLGQFIVQQIAINFIGINQDTQQFDFASDSQYVRFNLIGQIVTYIPGILYLLGRCGFLKNGLKQFGFIPRKPLRDIKLGVLGIVISLPLVFGISAIMVIISHLLGENVPEIGHVLLQKLADSTTFEIPLLLGIGAILLAPVFEEIFFRGVVQTALLNMLGKQQRWLVIFLAATGFALIHLSALPSWQPLPSLFLLGLIMGYVYEKTGSLLPPILIHMGFNAFNFSMVLLSATAKGA